LRFELSRPTRLAISIPTIGWHGAVFTVDHSHSSGTGYFLFYFAATLGTHIVHVATGGNNNNKS
jgi:hypothetical protein